MRVVSDEPLEVRREDALKRMHDKAVHDGKNVSLATDKSALFVDGNRVFSLKDVFLRSNGNVDNNTSNG